MNISRPDDGNDTGLPVKLLQGGFRWAHLNVPESIVTGKPLTGVYLGNIKATTVRETLDGTPQLFVHQVPHTAGCEPEAHPVMVRKVALAVIKSLDAQGKKDGSKWGGTPVMVEFQTCYMPTPIEHNGL